MLGSYSTDSHSSGIDQYDWLMADSLCYCGGQRWSVFWIGWLKKIWWTLCVVLFEINPWHSGILLLTNHDLQLHSSSPSVAYLGTGQASIIILSVKNALLPPRPQDEKTYPEVVSRSMPRTLKDFCQRACSQKIRRAPLEKNTDRTSLRSLYRPYLVRAILRFTYRP